MIRYNPKSWNLFLMVKGTLVKRLLGGIISIAIFSTLLVFLQFKFRLINIEVGGSLPGYLGAALGLLLVFRNNTAYDRWWEARKVLGALVNISRNIAITVNNLVPSSRPEKAHLYKLLIAFCYSLKEHLRQGVLMHELSLLDKEDYKIVEKAKHKPNIIANLMQKNIHSLHQDKVIDNMEQYLMLTNVDTLIDILGKCERIHKTPIPIAYAFLVKIFVIIYVVFLPLGLLDELGWYIVPLVVLLYYLLMSIVTTAEEIEDPFGRELNDLNVDDLCQNIERNVKEIVRHRESSQEARTGVIPAPSPD